MGTNAASLAHISALKGQMGLQIQMNTTETGVHSSVARADVTPVQMSYMSMSASDLNTKNIYALKYKEIVPNRH